MKMRYPLIAGWLITGLLATAAAMAQESEAVSLGNDTAIQFEDAVRLSANGQPINVESPGYACPSFADMNGDGLKDLLVGQFSGGKIKVYLNDGKHGFEAGDWLMTGEKVAEIPGVW